MISATFCQVFAHGFSPAFGLGLGAVLSFCSFSYFLGFFPAFSGAVLISAVSATFLAFRLLAGFMELFWDFCSFSYFFLGFFQLLAGFRSCFGDFCSFSYFTGFSPAFWLSLRAVLGFLQFQLFLPVFSPAFWLSLGCFFSTSSVRSLNCFF